MTSTATLTRPTAQCPLVLVLRLNAPVGMRAVGRLHAVGAAAAAGVRHLRLVAPRDHPQLLALWTSAVGAGMAVEIHDSLQDQPTPTTGVPTVEIGGDGRARLIIPGGIPVEDLLSGALTDLVAALHPALHAVHEATSTP